MSKLIALMVFFVATSCFATREFYQPTKSVRAMGMGGAIYGFPNDEYALFSNPAGLGVYPGQRQLMMNVDAETNPKTIGAKSTLTSLDGKPVTEVLDSLGKFRGDPLNARAAIFPYYLQRGFGVGLLVSDTKLSVGTYAKDFGTTLDVTLISDSALVAGYAMPVLTPGLTLGASARTYSRTGGRRSFTPIDIVQDAPISLSAKDLGGTGYGVDLDVGAIYQLPDPLLGLRNTVGLSFNNLIASRSLLFAVNGTPPIFSRTVSLGFSASFPGIGFAGDSLFLFDLAELYLGGEDDPHFGARRGAIGKHLNFGVETPLWNLLSVRAGIHQGNWTAGFGVNLTYFKLDFATYAEELANDVDRLTSRRFIVRLSFGYANTRHNAAN